MFIPEFKGSIEGYVVNFLKSNLWRISRTHDHEDAMQEAYLVFMRVASKYPLIEEPKHFMALFKTAWVREFDTLSHKARPHNMTISSEVEDDDDKVYSHDSIGELDNDGFLATMVRQAPQEVSMVLNLFLNAPQELLEMAMAAWRNSGRYRAEGDQAIARMLGLPEGAEPMRATLAYFTEEDSGRKALH